MKKEPCKIVPNKIDTLIVTVMESSFGMDMAQISGILSVDQMDTEGYDIVNFYEKLHFPENAVCDVLRRGLLIERLPHRTLILIDDLKDIVSIGIECIHPVPPLIKAVTKAQAIWAFALVNGKIISLVDVYQLLQK